jgi:protein-S-isoprenylcysteine O-methyltransferase Ste14
MEWQIGGTNMSSAHQQPSDAATGGVKLRPPLLFIAALLLGFALDHPLPLPVAVPRGGDLVHRMIPSALILIGIALTAAGIRNFARAGTPVPSNQPVRVLVTTGIHGWSRNPIYVGMFLLYIGVGIAVRSPWILILALPILIILRYGVVAREEAYLEHHFGDAYRHYKDRVHRWL